jgi:hypothetical protein
MATVSEVKKALLDKIQSQVADASIADLATLAGAFQAIAYVVDPAIPFARPRKTRVRRKRKTLSDTVYP